MSSDYKRELFKVLKPSDDKIQHELELAIKMGKIILLEQVGEKIPNEIEPLLTPSFKHKGKIKILK